MDGNTVRPDSKQNAILASGAEQFDFMQRKP